MDKIELTEDQIEKAIEEIVETEMEKSMPMESKANGEVETKNEGKLCTEEAAKEQKDDMKKKKKKKKEDMKKSDEEETKEEVSEIKEEGVLEIKEEEVNENIVKSLEELAQHVDSEELELIRLWREEKINEEKEEITKGLTDNSDVSALIKAEISTQIEPLQKALQEKDETIKNLNDKVEKMASQPAYDSRSITDLETIEKAEEEETTSPAITASQVLDVLDELQREGKGVNSLHIAQFEATKTLPNNIENMVKEKLSQK